MNNIAVSVSNVSKCYRVFDNQRSRLLHAIFPKYKKHMKEIWAVRNIDFEIGKGESVAIIGRNGGGKSTLLEILTGTLQPTSGAVNINGRVSALLELGSGFNPEFSGRDNVVLNGLLLGLSKNEIQSRFSEIEDFAEIGTAIDRPVKTYSSGMTMRLAFAVQVLCNPEILVIDEALSVGDFFFQQKCLAHIREMSEKGVTLLFVSHDMAVVRKVCKRAIYLDQGTRVYDGESKEAVRLYLSQQYATEASPHPLPTADIASAEYASPLWLNTSAGFGELYSIDITDLAGNPTTSFTMGETAKFDIKFFPSMEQPCDVTVGITNREGQLVTATGSMQLANPPDSFRSPNYLHRYIVEISLQLEAGNYGVEVALGARTNINQGSRFYKTPQIGPITINWDYTKDAAPFIGLVGLPCSGKFCEPIKIEFID